MEESMQATRATLLYLDNLNNQTIASLFSLYLKEIQKGEEKDRDTLCLIEQLIQEARDIQTTLLQISQGKGKET